MENLFDDAGLPKPFSRRPRLTVYRRELYDYAECINLAILLRGRFPRLDRYLSVVLNDILNTWQEQDGSFRSRHLLVGWDRTPMHRRAQSQLFRSLCFLLFETVKVAIRRKEHGFENKHLRTRLRRYGVRRVPCAGWAPNHRCGSGKTKVDLINAGKSTIIEAEIGELIAQAVESGMLRATDKTADAVENSELSFVCVGTPSQINGNLDLAHVRHVCEQIGRALRDKRERHTVVIRSTVLPGTMQNIVIPALEEYSGKKAGSDFGVCNNPEFLREGSAVKDFRFPSKTVMGELDRTSGDPLAALMRNWICPS